LDKDLCVEEKTVMKKKIKLYLVFLPALGILFGMILGLLVGATVLSGLSMFVVIVPSLILLPVMWGGFKKLFNKVDEL
jgi:hypothetical protein